MASHNDFQLPGQYLVYLESVDGIIVVFLEEPEHLKGVNRERLTQ